MVFLIIAVPDVENCCERKVNILANLRKSYLKDFIFSKVTTIKSVILPKMNLLRDFFSIWVFVYEHLRVAGLQRKEEGHFFNSSLLLPPALQTL